MKKSDLIIITNEHFPIGMAATNRLLSYSVEIAKYKKVLLLSYAWPVLKNEAYNFESDGMYKGIEFHYMQKPYREKQSKLIRFFLYYFACIKLFFVLLFKYNTKSYLYYSRGSFSIMLKIICLLKCQRMFIDTTETREGRPKREEMRFKKRAQLFNGIICISEGIISYFSFLGEKANLYLLPVCVELERFDRCAKKTNEKYFAYCSGMNLERDGFLDSLNAFLLFHKHHPNYKLKVATGLNHNEAYHQKVWQIMQQNTDCIDYLGMRPADEIPSLLKNAEALLITPHHNYVTRGFPTKLGEYLATGVPVVCTSIDDLKNNLEDGCVFMVNPNSPEEIFEKLEIIVADPILAKQTAARGRMYMEQHYTMKAHLVPLINFLQL